MPKNKCMKLGCCGPPWNNRHGITPCPNIWTKSKCPTCTTDLKKHNFEEIDLVIVNFYPFEKTLDVTNNHNKIIENIDVGGPTMVRAAAKNYSDVTVITNPEQYEELMEELNNSENLQNLKIPIFGTQNPPLKYI